MESSPEIRRVVDRWLVAARDADTESFVGKVSEQAGVLMVGTDEEEWWHAEDAAVWKQQLEELDGFPLIWDEIEAWDEGTVGWASANMKIGGPERQSPLRLTWVLHLERGEWKICRRTSRLVARTSRCWARS